MAEFGDAGKATASGTELGSKLVDKFVDGGFVLKKGVEETTHVDSTQLGFGDQLVEQALDGLGFGLGGGNLSSGNKGVD